MSAVSSLLLSGFSPLILASSLPGEVLILSFKQSSLPLPPQYAEEKRELTLSFPLPTLFRGEFTKEEEERLLREKLDYFLNFAKEKKYDGVLFGSWKCIPLYPLGRMYKEILEKEKELRVYFAVPEGESKLFQHLLS